MSYPYPQYQRAGTPRAPRGLRRDPRRGSRAPVTFLGRRFSPWMAFLFAALLFSLALLPVFVLGGTYTIYMVSGRVLPGVTAGWVPASDLTQAELAQKLDADWNRSQALLLSDGSRTWPVVPAELGLVIDSQATAARAHEVGRGSKALQEFIWLVRFGKLEVEPVVVFDPQTARAGLEKFAPQVSIPAQNAALRLENGEWVAVPGQNGSMVDIDATIQQAAAYSKEILATGVMPLVMQPVAPRVSDLTPALEQLRNALDHPLKVQAYDPITDETIDVAVPREVFATWVTVEPIEDGVAIDLDRQLAAAYLEQWEGDLGSERALEPFTLPDDLTARWQNGQPVSATIRHNPTSYTVESGDTLTRIAFKVGMPYWKIQQANPDINPDQLRAGDVLTIPSKNDMLPLPVVPNKRIVISISQQHMWTYENGSLRTEHVISTGIDRSPTVPGVYQIRTHDLEAYASVWDLYMPHFMGIYEGWPGFMNGIHGLPTLSSGNRLWAGSLGRPVSYGCIILGLEEAEALYNWAEEGVVVEIQP